MNYRIIDEKIVGKKTDGSGTFSTMKTVRIICDTAEDIPQPLPDWEAGSRCDVLENDGSVYILSTSGAWLKVNFYNWGGDGGGSAPDLSNYYTKPQTDSKITEKVAGIIADAPEDFDTLKEISDWISSHEDSAAAMNSAIQENARKIETKVDKAAGMGLSQNSFTNEEKTKLAGLSNHYEVGETISSSTDLNDMKAIGSYACPTGAVAASLTNCPYKNTGFRLDIFYTSSVNYLKQVLHPNQMGNDSNVYQRTYINSTGEWSPWYKIASEAVTAN